MTRDGATDRFHEPSAGRVVGRGAGYGALLGAFAGLFVAPVSAAFTFEHDWFDPGTFVLGVFTGPIGLLYGIVVGAAAGAAVLSVPLTVRTRAIARLVAGLVGPSAVALISWLVFRPDLTIGVDESSDYALETWIIFYLYPAAAAGVCGVIGGPRLIACVRPPQ